MIETRCHDGIPCREVTDRLEVADRQELLYGLDGGPLRAMAREIARRHLEAEEGHRSNWGLSA